VEIKRIVTALGIEDLTDVREDMDFGPKNFLVCNFWAFRMSSVAFGTGWCTKDAIASGTPTPTRRSTYCFWAP